MFNGSDRFSQIFYHVKINWSEGVHVTFSQEKNVYEHVNMLVMYIHLSPMRCYLTKCITIVNH